MHFYIKYNSNKPVNFPSFDYITVLPHILQFCASSPVGFHSLSQFKL